MKPITCGASKKGSTGRLKTSLYDIHRSAIETSEWIGEAFDAAVYVIFDLGP